MTFGEILPDARVVPGLATLAVAGLATDSRAVKAGDVFFAVPGSRADGLGFVKDAVERGAVAVVSASAVPDLPERVGRLVVPDVRVALAEAAARFHAGQPDTIVAVTGTSGKTSVAVFVRQIWAHAGLRAASLGTIGLVAPSGEIKGALTTPDPITLHWTLEELARDGVTHLAIEASSHGLDQHRLDGVRLAAGAFTNLSRDHLDYHPDLASYLAAKARLFNERLAPGAAAVVDTDSEAGRTIAAVARTRRLELLTVGRSGDAITLLDAVPDGEATMLRLRVGGRDASVRLPLVGLFQVQNALVAAGLCIATGSTPKSVLEALERLKGAPGRLEFVGERNGARVFVDYAHKPDALEQVLTTLRPYATGRLAVVFGCGGDRDPGKRPIMGAIAQRLADVVIVTDDNPRSEDPALIRAAILEAAPGAREIGDRAAAIETAVAALEPGDLLLVAGKGHETGQIVGTTTLPFSDQDAVRTALGGAERGNAA